MNVLFFGLGSIAKKHIVALRQIEPNSKVYALRSSRTAKSWEGIQDLYDWDEVYSKEFDFAIISNPTSEHLGTIEKLLPLDIALFIEKPLNSVLVNEDWVKKVNKDRITYCACNLRFLDCLHEVKKLVEDKIVNEVNVYCGSYLPEWRPGVDFRTVYSAIPELGGGVHIDLIHEIDYLYWFFGNPQKVHKTFSNKSSLGIRAYDYANYLLEYWNFNVNVVLNYYRRDYKRTIELVCEDATYLIDLVVNSIYKNNELVYSSRQKMTELYLPQMEYFINCIKEHRETFNTIYDANQVLNICLKDETE